MSQTAPLPIAVVLSSFDAGGTEAQTIQLIRRLDPDRWRVHVACFHARGPWLDRAVEAAASIEEFPLRSFTRPGTLVQMQAFGKWCRAHRVVLVHTAELYANIFGLPAAALGGVPVRIGSRREINPDKTPLQIAVQRAAYACAHQVVANSQAAARRLAFERVPAGRITVIPNGLDLAHYHSPRPARSSASRLRRVVMVANFRSEKGHDVLMRAAVRVLARHPDVTFDLVGGGDGRPQFETLAAALGVSHAFTFSGHQDDVAAHLAAADLFVLPSRSEAFPNALLEAMAAGLPIVASGVGGILELIHDGRNGLLAPAGDEAALASQLLRLMDDPPFSAALGAAARSTVDSHYSFERMVTAFDTLYLTELSRHGVVPARTSRIAA